MRRRVADWTVAGVLPSTPALRVKCTHSFQRTKITLLLMLRTRREMCMCTALGDEFRRLPLSSSIRKRALQLCGHDRLFHHVHVRAPHKRLRSHSDPHRKSVCGGVVPAKAFAEGVSADLLRKVVSRGHCPQKRLRRGVVLGWTPRLSRLCVCARPLPDATRQPVRWQIWTRFSD